MAELKLVDGILTGVQIRSNYLDSKTIKMKNLYIVCINEERNRVIIDITESMFEFYYDQPIDFKKDLLKIYELIVNRSQKQGISCDLEEVKTPVYALKTHFDKFVACSRAKIIDGQLTITEPSKPEPENMFEAVIIKVVKGDETESYKHTSNNDVYAICHIEHQKRTVEVSIKRDLLRALLRKSMTKKIVNKVSVSLKNCDCIIAYDEYCGYTMWSVVQDILESRGYINQ